ncbi:MAG: cytochrome c biogenesis protein CcsA [Ectothiorhodospiraceae bacterium]|nr:cytochrome c biogenesis protein CcsA [Chromatiales bacterium]MCP5154589.1 cytochrome c biogenesis protein CcsA [Ectothiorhodospiraceae bacterium]
MPEVTWLGAGTTGYAVAMVLALRDALARRENGSGHLLVLALGVGCFGIGLALRWLREGQGPFLTPFEVMASNAFSLGLVYLVVALGWPAVRVGATAITATLLVLGLWLLGTSAQVNPLPPSYDNAWLWAHVLTGKVFFGITLVASGIAVTRLVARRHVSEGARLDAAAWRLMQVAFVFQSAMLLSGAGWARDAWGRFWAWDPLETWALFTWLVLGAALHARATWRLPERLSHAMILTVFVLAWLTFLGVPFVSRAVHKGIL